MSSGDIDTPIHTYHCLCTNLLFASTTAASALPTRSNSLDSALILPLPASPPKSEETTHYAILLSTTVTAKLQVITKSDGFEKRWIQRCGRCKVVIAYQLDWTHWGTEAGERHGRRHDVMFLLPGGFMDTKDMIVGKDMTQEVRLGVET
ncbi:hypothetical protein EJ05DRAFT_495959 [Pseudovirgaria hyperparasitica]|uniref:STEEP1 domain-containing protein n=1 Tax=Pseudovirgaria hyperparasitica TaxID=470096 RepID=A0A6A6WLQ5_9PEZI|nr:uncharacterized protein EJ05DRAFT_495959 [Pseudovirgaria hyperparasitica]KAF2763121.1 hypothetical protein EJ05DRAFT_495959 [Pseudovirgaria hyperparasitica]